MLVSNKVRLLFRSTSVGLDYLPYLFRSLWFTVFNCLPTPILEYLISHLFEIATVLVFESNLQRYFYLSTNDWIDFTISAEDYVFAWCHVLYFSTNDSDCHSYVCSFMDGEDLLQLCVVLELCWTFYVDWLSRFYSHPGECDAFKMFLRWFISHYRSLALAYRARGLACCTVLQASFPHATI